MFHRSVEGGRNPLLCRISAFFVIRMACCKKSSGMSSDVLDEIQGQLGRIENVFPKTTFSALLTNRGEIM